MKIPSLLLVSQIAMTAPLLGQGPSAAERNLAYGLERSEAVELVVTGDLGEARIAEWTLDGQTDYLVLEPHSVRTAGFNLFAQVEGGRLVSVNPGPVSTIQGFLASQPGSTVRGGFQDSGLYAKLELADGSVKWIEPLQRQFPMAASNLHILYDSVDVRIPARSHCGTLAADQPVYTGGSTTTSFAASIQTAELAADADFDYYQDWGSSVNNVSNRIQTVIAAMNGQYETELSLTHAITTIIVRTSSNDNPYTTNGPSALLGEFKSEWQDNQQGIQRDIAQLFTGRNLTGGTIGIADPAAICSSTGSSLVQSDFTGNFSCVTDLSAHELGHNWNAGHCNCPNRTMNPSITCANSFGPVSLGQINTFLATRTCLSNGPPCQQDSLENNDNCTLARLIPPGLTTGIVASEDDRDFFLFEIDGFGTLNVDVLFQHGQGDLDAVLSDDICSNTVVLDSGTSSTDNETVTYFNPSSQPIAVRLEVQYISGTGCVDYDLDVVSLPGDPCLQPDDLFEPNDNCSMATPVGDLSLQDYFLRKASPDFFELCVDPGDTLSVDAFFAHASGDLDLYLYSSLGCGAAQLASSTSSTDTETITWVNTTGISQTYVLEARIAASSVPDCSPYLLEISGAGGNCVPPTAVGQNYCGPAVPNSTGSPATIAGFGSDLAAANDLLLVSTGLPQNKAGYYLASLTQDFLQGPGGSDGNLCLGSPSARLVAQVMNSGPAGSISVQVDTTNIPSSPPQPILAGETWNFQLWYRDTNPTSTSNFTDALSIPFQ